MFWLLGGIVASHFSFSSVRNELWGSTASSVVPAVHCRDGLFGLVDHVRGLVSSASGDIAACHCTARLFSATTITFRLMPCVQAIAHLARSHRLRPSRPIDPSAPGVCASAHFWGDRSADGRARAVLLPFHSPVFSPYQTGHSTVFPQGRTTDRSIRGGGLGLIN